MRALILSLVAAVAVLLGVATAWGVSGSSGDVGASAAQYPTSAVLPVQEESRVAPQDTAVALPEETPQAEALPDEERQALPQAAPVSTPAPAKGGLPFTGSDVLVALGIGLVLLLSGIALRRATSSRLA